MTKRRRREKVCVLLCWYLNAGECVLRSMMLSGWLFPTIVACDFAENANRMLFCEGDESKENGNIALFISLSLSTYLPTNLRMIIIILLVG